MDGAFLRCTSLECGARTARSLTYWCRSLEMDGIGEKLIDALLEKGLIVTIADLYRLEQTQISSLERMGDKSAKNVLDELKKTRTLGLARFLHALGMERIGPEVAAVISQHFTSLEKLLIWIDNGENEDLTSIDGIGEKVAEIFRHGISNRRALIEELSNIIEITNEIDKGQGILDGKTFCLTGTLSNPRKTVQSVIKSAGGKVVSGVSGNLNYLVVGKNAGSKLSKAKQLGVNILTEEELMAFVSTEDDSEANDLKQPSLFDY